MYLGLPVEIILLTFNVMYWGLPVEINLLMFDVIYWGLPLEIILLMFDVKNWGLPVEIALLMFDVMYWGLPADVKCNILRITCGDNSADSGLKLILVHCCGDLVLTEIQIDSEGQIPRERLYINTAGHLRTSLSQAAAKWTIYVGQIRDWCHGAICVDKII